MSCVKSASLVDCSRQVEIYFPEGAGVLLEKLARNETHELFFVLFCGDVSPVASDILFWASLNTARNHLLIGPIVHALLLTCVVQKFGLASSRKSPSTSPQPPHSSHFSM